MANIHPAPSWRETGSRKAAPGKGMRGIRLVSSFLLSAIFSLVQYSLKVTVTNSDNFNTINKLGKEAGGGRAKKITRVEIFYRHLTGYVQDRVGLAGTGHAAARGASPSSSHGWRRAAVPRDQCQSPLQCRCGAGLDAPARREMTRG